MLVYVSEYVVVVAPGETVDGANCAAIRLLLSENPCSDKLSTAVPATPPPTTGVAVWPSAVSVVYVSSFCAHAWTWISCAM